MIQTTLVNIYGGSIEIALDVGPMPDNTYAYGFTDSDGWVVSEARYANAESAKHDARRPQQLTLKATLEPLPSDKPAGELGEAMDESEYAWAHFDLGLGADGLWRYAVGDALSKNAFANKVDAYRYAVRPQRLNDEGFLVPDIRWSPELNLGE